MKINDYTDQATIASGDKWIGTSAADGSTKNFDIDDVANYVENNITGYTGYFIVNNGSLRINVAKGLIKSVVEII